MNINQTANKIDTSQDDKGYWDAIEDVNNQFGYSLLIEDTDEENESEEEATPTGTVWGNNGSFPETVSPTRHNLSTDSRERIKSLKNMVGHEVPDNFDPHDISWVLPTLGVTGAEGAERAIEQGHFVINVAGEISNGATVKMPIEPSNPTWGIKRANTVLQTLEAIVDTIEMVEATGQKAVVHCSMGMERSVLATVWYLVRNKGMSLDNAYNFVRSVRPIATDRRAWLIE